jgi:membrane-bound ClpP family serine protease
MRYALIQVPELIMLILVLVLLRQWMNIPVWIVWTFVILWTAVNVVMFPFLWRAFEKKDASSLPGSRGITIDRLSPSGYVRINNELWHARAIDGESAIEKNEVVSIKDMHGLTLFVESENKE